MANNRLYALDNLKWFIIWLMVVFHAALCYMAYPPEWWYVIDAADPSFAATIFVSWTDIFIMPVMFFISGYFGWHSLTKHGLGKFWAKKIGRIILPWIFGSMCIAPFVTYIMLASRNSPMGFWEFYTTLFWGVLYEQAQYWYLGALVALYLLLTVAFALCPALRTPVAGRPGGGFFWLLFAVAAVSIGVISSYMPPDTWSFYAYILVLQPVRVPLYIAVFFAGVWGARSGWFSSGGYVPGAGWGVPFLIAGGFYVWQRLFLTSYGYGAPASVWVNALAQAAFTIAAVFFFLGSFCRRCNFTTPTLKSLAATSYGVYYLHMPIVFCLAWVFRDTPLPAIAKYLCVSSLSLICCYLPSKWWVKA